MLQAMPRGCHLTVYKKKQVNLSCGKALTTYMYKLTLLNFIVSYHWNSQKINGIGRDPMRRPYHIYSYLPNAHLITIKETKINTAHMVS